MKRSLLFSVLVFFLCFNNSESQISGFVRSVAKNVQKDIVGDKTTSPEKKTQAEPKSACDQAELILDLGGKLKVDYSEISLTMGDDGQLLVQDRISSDYYIVKNGVLSGPYHKGDAALNQFGVTDEDNQSDTFLHRYPSYISKEGDKLIINFMGKKYGPYAIISQFEVTRSKDKFAAVVTENVMVTEDQGKKMEEAMKNAKTDQERMDLAMKMASEMQSKVMSAGVTSALPKFISNIADATFDPSTNLGGQMKGSMKYDDILVYYYNKITDLKGNLVLNITPGSTEPGHLFVSSDNSNYANFDFGTLTFKDKSTLPEVFNPYLMKTNGKVYLAYMYYSPKRNSIMQCKVPF